MSTRSVKVTIDQLGRPKVEANGFLGASCEVATKPIEDALAGQGPVERVFKEEWAATESAEQTEEVRNW